MWNCILAGIFILVAGFSGCRRSAPNAVVAARVNGRDILRSEVEKYFHFRTQGAPQQPAGEMANLLKLEILRDLIESEIMLQKAEELKLLASDSEVEAQFQEMKARTTSEEFQKDLEQRGFTEQELRRDIRRKLNIQKLVQNQVSSKVRIAEPEVSRFYEENKDSFNVKEIQYRIGQIIVTGNPDAPVTNSRNDKAKNADQASKKVQLLESKLEGGEDFLQLAREYSEDPQTAPRGGDLGYYSASALDRLGPQLKQTLLQLKVGEITPILRAQDGFMILKLLEKREPGQRKLDDPEVQQSIREELKKRKQQLLSSVFSEQLRNRARVENFLAREVLAEFQKVP